MVYVPGDDGAARLVVKAPPGEVVTPTEPVGPLTVTGELPVKYEPLMLIAPPG